MRGGFLSDDKRKVQRSQPVVKSCLRFESKCWLLGPVPSERNGRVYTLVDALGMGGCMLKRSAAKRSILLGSFVFY